MDRNPTSPTIHYVRNGLSVEPYPTDTSCASSRLDRTTAFLTLAAALVGLITVVMPLLVEPPSAVSPTCPIEQRIAVSNGEQREVTQEPPGGRLS